ncbi:MAG: hypothetical protein RI885_2330 [Actinomycetota bacterium]
MIVYLDSSALVKRARDESESAALEAELVDRHRRGDVFLSSSLAWVDVSRALRSRVDAEHPSRIADLIDGAMSGVVEHPMDNAVTSLARRLDPSTLRSLDAIHLATAILADVDLVVAYDERMIASAEELGLRTGSPE